MKVVVSACLLGENCKYSGGNNRCDRLIERLSERPDIEVIPVCPEVAGGLPTPRPPAEIVDGEVVNNQGVSVDAEYRAGIAAEMERLAPMIDADGEVVNNQGVSVDAEYRAGIAAEMERLAPMIDAGEVAAAVLQSRSPSCGVHEVYDGTFTGRLIPGQGLFAEALAQAGVMLIDAADVE